MVFGLFSKEKSLQKTIDKATNKLAQQPDRWAALEKLKEDGSEEALFGLCKRFGITSSKGIEDEQEKDWVVETLVSKGTETQLPPRANATADELKKHAEHEQALERQRATVLSSLVRYMKGAGQLAFPLRVLERIAERDRVLEIVDGLFASEPPGYVRLPERRIDLIHWFAEWKAASDDEVVARLTPYVADFDENSRFAAIDGLATKDPAKIAGPLIAALLRPEEESGRIKRTVVEVMARSQAPLGDQADAVAAAIVGARTLAAEFKVAGGVIKRA
jgi:hypothetical protein